MTTPFDYEDIRRRALQAPRLNELLQSFELIAAGHAQVPCSVPDTHEEYLGRSSDLRRHERIFRRCLGIFYQHGIASIPCEPEEFLRVDRALRDLALHRGATVENPLSYWETSSADGTRARTLAEYAEGVIVTLSDSPNLANKREFDRSAPHPYSFFHHGPFVDICPDYLRSQTYHPAFREGFDVVWENTTFQMYGDNRAEQIAYVEQSLKPDGLLILFEKLNADEYSDYCRMERLKDEFKSRYFEDSQIVNKKEEILDTMQKGQVTLRELANVARQSFAHGALIWNATNFYEVVATNSEKTLHDFLSFLPEPYVPDSYVLERPMVRQLWGGTSGDRPTSRTPS